MKMRWSVLSGAMAIAATALSSISARAADRYTLKIETSLMISEQCALADGQTQTSRIELIIDDSTESDVDALTKSVGRIRVCSPFTSPVRENIPMPLPVGFMHQMAKVSVGKSIGIDIPAARFGNYFTSMTPPDRVEAKKINDGLVELIYMDKATRQAKIGPIRAYVGPSKSLQDAKGYSSVKHLPISRVEIDVPDKGVTLRANIVSVDSAQ